MSVHKPRRLRQGARIGVIAPSGVVDQASVHAGAAAIRSEGFAVELAPNVFARRDYLAGQAEDRARDLTEFFRRPDIDAVFCARGGFGSVQLLPYLDASLGSEAKIFVGYSDVTILLNWFRQFGDMVTFHAPMVAMDLAQGLTGSSRQHFWPLLTGETQAWKINLGEVIRPGTAQSDIVGGCLSLVVTTLGTPYEVDTRGKLLFLEDVGEKPYRIERMLTHLQMAGKFHHVAGVLCGDFTNCDSDGGRQVEDILREMFGRAAYPVVIGMKAGHGAENLALPFGVQMRLDGERATLEMLESPVV
jgi:muramoyltetrapeptide carboxypeptidase